jgi:hypothetical protein
MAAAEPPVAGEAVTVLLEELDHLLLPGVEDREAVEYGEVAGERVVTEPSTHVGQRVVVGPTQIKNRHVYGVHRCLDFHGPSRALIYNENGPNGDFLPAFAVFLPRAGPGSREPANCGKAVNAAFPLILGPVVAVVRLADTGIHKLLNKKSLNAPSALFERSRRSRS